MDIVINFPLLAAIIAIFLAQTIKIPIHFIISREFKPGLAFSTGGMPSSHSAAVVALSTSIGITEGVDSSIFAVAAVFSMITMYDASGIRRQAGQQAMLLNRLRQDFQYFLENAKDWNKMQEYEKRKELKELLGHQPIEVFFGGLFGFMVAFLLYPILM